MVYVSLHLIMPFMSSGERSLYVGILIVGYVISLLVDVLVLNAKYKDRRKRRNLTVVRKYLQPTSSLIYAWEQITFAAT